MRTSLTRLLAALAVVVVALAGCGDPGGGVGETGQGSEDEFVVGAILPLTGNLAVLGQSDLIGLRAQIDILNARGGVLGRPVRLEHRDDASDPQRAVAAAQELLSTGGLRAIFTDPVSANAIATLPVLTQARMLSVTHCGAAACTDPAKYPYQFSLAVPVVKENGIIGRYATQSLGARRVALFGGADATGQTFLASMRESVERQGAVVTGAESYDIASKDLTSQLQALRGGNPDLLLLQGNGAPVGVVMQGLLDLGWSVPVVGESGSANTDWAAIVPAAARPQLTAVTYAISGRQGDAMNPDYQGFFEAAAKHGDLQAPATAATMADALLTVAWAYEQAGGLDMQKAADALNTMESATIPPDYFWVFRNSSPAFNATTHNTNNADVSQGFYWVLRDSPVIDGTRLGSPIDVG